MRSSKFPVIRPGQHVPYRKGTEAEIDRRRGYVARLLARDVPKMIIHRAVRQQFNREWRTCDRDIAFVTDLANKWLTRARAKYCQIPIPENFATWWRAYGDKAT